MPGLFDHLIAVLLVVIWPIWVAFRGRKALRDLADDPSQMMSTYVWTLVSQWAHFAGIAALWIGLDRSWSSLGLGFEASPGFFIAAVVSLLICGQLWGQWKRAQADSTLAERLSDQLAELEGFLPRTRQEVLTMRALAVTAGICEEVACRGFLLWYLAHWMPLPVAVVVMATAFGASHLYQGPGAALQIAGIAVAAAALYLLSGSLWIPIVLHTLLDLNQLAIVRIALAARENEEEATPAADTSIG